MARLREVKSFLIKPLNSSIIKQTFAKQKICRLIKNL